MATGTAVLDFGANPGKGMASVDVTGQAAITGTSRVESWVKLEATADHSVDEHRVETLRVRTGDPSAGTGFTIYGEIELGSAWGQYNVNWVWI